MDFGRGAGLADQARPCNVRGHVSSPANGGLIPEDRGEPLDAVDTVLKRNHAGVAADERARLLTRALGVPELYGE